MQLSIKVAKFKRGGSPATHSIRDRIIKMGAGNQTTPCITMRLVEIKVGKAWIENRDLGVVKSVRKPFKKLIIDPFPDRASRVVSYTGRKMRID